MMEKNKRNIGMVWEEWRDGKESMNWEMTGRPKQCWIILSLEMDTVHETTYKQHLVWHI